MPVFAGLSYSPQAKAATPLFARSLKDGLGCRVRGRATPPCVTAFSGAVLRLGKGGVAPTGYEMSVDAFVLAGRVVADVSQSQRALTDTQKRLLELVQNFQKTEQAAKSLGQGVVGGLRPIEQATDRVARGARQMAQELTAAQRAGRGALQGMQGELNGLANRIPVVGGMLSSVAASLSGVGAAATLGLGALVVGTAAAGAGALTLAQYAANAADRIRDLSIKTGLSVETLSGLDLIARQSGTNLEALANGVFILQRNMDAASRGGREMSAAFQRLGINVRELNGEHASMDEVLRRVFAGLARIPDTARRNAAGAQVMGRSYRELSILFASVGGDMDAFIAKAREMGLVISQEQADAADRFNDSMEQIKAQIGAVIRTVGAGLVPEITRGMDDIGAALQRNGGNWDNWADRISENVGRARADLAAFASFAMAMLANPTDWPSAWQAGGAAWTSSMRASDLRSGRLIDLGTGSPSPEQQAFLNDSTNAFLRRAEQGRAGGASSGGGSRGGGRSSGRSLMDELREMQRRLRSEFNSLGEATFGANENREVLRIQEEIARLEARRQTTLQGSARELANELEIQARLLDLERAREGIRNRYQGTLSNMLDELARLQHLNETGHEETQLERLQREFRDPRNADAVDEQARKFMFLTAREIEATRALAQLNQEFRRIRDDQQGDIRALEESIAGAFLRNPADHLRLHFELNPIPEGLKPQQAQLLENQRRQLVELTRTEHATRLYADTLQQLNQQIGLSSARTGLQRLEYELAKGALRDLTAAQAEHLSRLQEQADEMERFEARIEQVAASLTSVFDNALTALEKDGFGGFFAAVLQGFSDMLRQMSMELLQSQILQMLSNAGNSGGGGILSKLLNIGIGAISGGLLPGSSAAGKLPKLHSGFAGIMMPGFAGGGGRASGGDIFAGRAYLVGEQGPELILPNRNAYVVPNHQLGQGGGNSNQRERPISVNVYVQPNKQGRVQSPNQIRVEILHGAEEARRNL